MLNIMFKDFMVLLQTVCNHSNSRKCERIFKAYTSALFEQLNFKKGFDVICFFLSMLCVWISLHTSLYNRGKT